MRSTPLFLPTLSLALSIANLAHAGEPTDAEKRAAAEAIFAQATDLVGKRDFAAACPKFEEVVKLQPNGIGARMSLGDCYVYQGKLASAHATFGQAASMASLANQPERAVDAQEKAAAIAPRLSYLTIEVPVDVAALGNLAVMRGGLVVSPSLFNVPVPVDNGYYTIVADADGRKPFTKSLKITQEGSKEKVVLELALVGAEEPAAGNAPPASVPIEDADVARGMAPVRIGGIVVGSVGLALGAIGIGVAVSGVQSANEASQRTGAEALADYEAGTEQRDIGAALAGVGGAALVAGLIMIIAAPDAKDAPTEASTAPSMQWGIGPASAWMGVTF